MKRKEFIRNEKMSRPFLAADGATVYEIFHPRSSNIKNLSFASGFLKVGKTARSHYHKLSEEIYFILLGQGKVRLGTIIFNVEKNDVIYVPVGMIHGLINTHPKQPLRILAIASPPYSDDDIFFAD